MDNQNQPEKSRELIELVLNIRKDCRFILSEAKLSNDQTLVESGNPEYLKLTATVYDTGELRSFLRGLGTSAEVLSPPSLRNYYENLAAELYKIYMPQPTDEKQTA